MLITYAVLYRLGLVPRPPNMGLLRRRERFGGGGGDLDVRGTGAVVLALWVLALVVSIPLLLLAVYLSWTSNTVAGHHPASKLLFAIFAAIFHGGYLLSHLLHKLDLLHRIRDVSALAAPAPLYAPPASLYAPAPPAAALPPPQ